MEQHARAQQQALHVAVERERARRLVDRFGRDVSEGGELAREKRAHLVSAEFRRERATSSDRNGSGFEQLEALLEGKRRDNLQALLTEDQSTTPGAGSSVESKPAAGASATLSAASGSERTQTPAEMMKNTLDEISVKSILDFRSSGSGIPSAEAVATAAACTIANIDDTVRLDILSLDPETPWPQALTMLSKPGHFINTLRRFPYAVASGHVPEDNIVAARHYLAMADAEDIGVGVHPAVCGLQRWVECAVQSWEDHASAQEAATSQVPQAPQRETVPAVQTREETFRPAPRTVQSPGASTPVRPRSSQALGQSSSGVSSCRISMAPAGQPKPAVPKQRSGASPRPNASPRSRPSAAGATTPGVPSRGTARPGVGTSGSATAAGRSAVSPRPRPMRASTATSSIPSAAVAKRAASPQLRRRPTEQRPVTQAPAPKAQPTRPQQSPQQSTTLAKPRATSPAATRASSPRQSPMRNGRLGASKSVGNLNRGSTASAPSSAVASRQGCSTTGPSVNAVIAAAQQPHTMMEFRRMIEETKKEVREIRALEAQMKWNMNREEEKQKVMEEKAIDTDIREWRWKEIEEAKAFEADKRHEEKILDLQESKAFQEFKRDVKIQEAEANILYNQEVYNQNIENAAWREEVAQEILERDKEVVANRVEGVQHLREVRQTQKLMAKAEEDETRALEQSLEMANMARELAREKDQLLQSLETLRACQKVPVGSASRNSGIARSSGIGR